MQEQGTARRGGTAFIWKWGAISGVVLGVIQIIISLFSPGSLKTILDFLVWLIGFFVLGLFAARQTGRVRTGALVGLVTGLIGSLITVIFVIVQIATNGQVITQALNRSGVSPGELNTADVVGIVLALIVTPARAWSGSGHRRAGRPRRTASGQATHIHIRCRYAVDPTVASFASFTSQTSSLGFPPERRVRGAGDFAGAVLALLTAGLLMNAQVKSMQTTTNGWSITMQRGEASNSILQRSACAQTLPMVNLPQEAVYWTATVDGAGQMLTGGHDYRLHFPPGGLPPTHAFWSLTMTNTQGQMVANPSNRYSVSDRSGLVPNADGSIDISIQHAAPAGHEANWLPAPSGNFKLWLRVYQPGAAILSGAYHVPPVVEVY